jgi:hypothetical protein
VILYPGKGMTRRSRLAAGLAQVIRRIVGLRMRVDSFENVESVTATEYDPTQESTVEGIPRP